MNCLFCNKAIIESANADEINNRWHKRCVRKFFGTDKFPGIDFSNKMLKELAIKSIQSGYTVPGVQKKISIHLINEENNPRLTLLNYPAGFILKPQTDEYQHLPEAEHLVMKLANITGIKTVPFALTKMSSQNNSFAYITKRIDRTLNSANHTVKLAMEDFCQLDGRLTRDKYRGSYERCAGIITKYSSRPGFDLSELFLRIIFSFVTGNSDMHLKNFSLIETSYNSGEYVLSEAYDMIPANIIIPEDTEQFALTLNGKKRNIRLKDFLIFAKSIGMPEKSAKKMIKKVASFEDEYILICKNSYISKEMKDKFESLIRKRIAVFDE